MATSQSYQGDLKNNWHTKLEYLHLDYTHREVLHKWVRMPECDEFVGAKYVQKYRKRNNRVIV